METIHVTLPDGSVKDVPKGTTPLDIANGISPRLGSAALVARVFTKDGPFVGEPDFILESGAKEEGELIDLRLPAFRRAFDGRGGDGPLSRREIGYRAAGREWIFLRISARAAVHPGRSGENRKE